MGQQIKLNVFAERAGSGINFGLNRDGDLPPGVELNGSVLKIRKSAGTGNSIVFKLKDGNLRLSFADQPIWVAAGGSCPTEPGTSGFQPEVNGDKLVVRVPDSPGNFGYTLRFTDAQGTPCDFDPIIMNMV